MVFESWAETSTAVQTLRVWDRTMLMEVQLTELPIFVSELAEWACWEWPRRSLWPTIHSVVRKWPPKYKRRFRQPFRNAPNDSNHTHETRLHQVVGNFYSIGDSGRMGMGVVKSSIIRLLYYLMTHVGRWYGVIAEILSVHGLQSLLLIRYCIHWTQTLHAPSNIPSLTLKTINLLMQLGMWQVGSYLQQLKDGLHGALFIGSADESGITLFTSTQERPDSLLLWKVCKIYLYTDLYRLVQTCTDTCRLDKAVQTVQTCTDTFTNLYRPVQTCTVF